MSVPYTVSLHPYAKELEEDIARRNESIQRYTFHNPYNTDQNTQDRRILTDEQLRRPVSLATDLRSKQYDTVPFCDMARSGSMMPLDERCISSTRIKSQNKVLAEHDYQRFTPLVPAVKQFIHTGTPGDRHTIGEPSVAW